MPGSITYPIEFAAPLQAFCTKAGIKVQFRKAKRYVRITRFGPEDSSTIAEAGPNRARSDDRYNDMALAEEQKDSGSERARASGP